MVGRWINKKVKTYCFVVHIIIIQMWQMLQLKWFESAKSNSKWMKEDKCMQKYTRTSKPVSYDMKIDNVGIRTWSRDEEERKNEEEQQK